MEHSIILQAPPGPPDNPRGSWPEKLRREFDANRFSGAVGNRLVYEDERCRVWHVYLAPGAFSMFHRHVLDYFWTVVTAGVARGYYEDGRIQDVHHYPGETRYFKHGAGEYFIHGIENIGQTDLIFVTVEFLLGGNPPIEVPDSYRLVTPNADAKDEGSSSHD